MDLAKPQRKQLRKHLNYNLFGVFDAKTFWIRLLICIDYKLNIILTLAHWGDIERKYVLDSSKWLSTSKCVPSLTWTQSMHRCILFCISAFLSCCL